MGNCPHFPYIPSKQANWPSNIHHIEMAKISLLFIKTAEMDEDDFMSMHYLWTSSKTSLDIHALIALL